MPVKGPENGKGPGETDLDQDQSESGQGALGDDATTQEDASKSQETRTAEANPANQDGQRGGEKKEKVLGKGGQPGRSPSRPMKPPTKLHGQEQARAPPVSDKPPVKLPHVGVKKGGHSRHLDAKKSFAAEKAALLASRRA